MRRPWTLSSYLFPPKPPLRSKVIMSNTISVNGSGYLGKLENLFPRSEPKRTGAKPFEKSMAKNDPFAVQLVAREFRGLTLSQFTEEQALLNPALAKAQDSFNLRVLSYNVLANAYTTDSNCIRQYPDKDRNLVQDFYYRSHLILREITGLIDPTNEEELKAAKAP